MAATKYATANQGGRDYRDIAEIMTSNGDEMNFAIARNLFLKAMVKVANEICKLVEHDTSQYEVKRIAEHPQFQSAIQDIMQEI